MMFADVINRNNRAVDTMLQGESAAAGKIFRECFISAKESLMKSRSRQSDDADEHTSSTSCDGSANSSPVYPSRKPLAEPLDTGAAGSDFYIFRQPLYIDAERLLEDRCCFAEHQNSSNDPEQSVGQLVLAVVIFNMALYFHLCSSSHRGTNLAKAKKLYLSAAILVREVPQFFISIDLGLLVFNNLIQVSNELGDLEQAQDALRSLQELCALRCNLCEDDSARCILVESNAVALNEIVTNTILLNVSTRVHVLNSKYGNPSQQKNVILTTSSCAGAA